MSVKLGKDGHYMKCPNRLPIIVGGIIGAVALICCICLATAGNKDANVAGTQPTDTNISIQVPETTVPDGPDVFPPAVVIPDPTDPYQPEEGDPFVESDEGTDTEIKVPVEEDEKKDVIIVEEDTIVGEDKDDVHVGGDNSDSDDNAPEYEKNPGGDNPFDSDIKTEINDTPVEEYIGEGEDRPGEGIHF